MFYDIYGGIFRPIKKELLKLFDLLRDFKEDIKPLPYNFSKCFVNDALVQKVKSVLLALKNKGKFIIVWNDESGLTQIAEWCSKYFNNEKKSKKSDSLLFFCFCIKNFEYSDLIGT